MINDRQGEHEQTTVRDTHSQTLDAYIYSIKQYGSTV